MFLNCFDVSPIQQAMKRAPTPTGSVGKHLLAGQTIGTSIVVFILYYTDKLILAFKAFGREEETVKPEKVLFIIVQRFDTR